MNILIGNKFVVILILVTWAITSSSGQLNFTCDNGDVTSMMHFCDGRQHCDDGSDEISTSSNCPNCSDVMIECRTGPRSCFIHFEYICNGSIACRSVSPCDVGCPEFYQCNGQGCERRSTVCDGDRLNGCPEDDGWKTGIGFQCVRNGELCRIPQQMVLDDVQDCDQGEDLCFDWPDDSRGLSRNARCDYEYENIVGVLCDGVGQCPPPNSTNAQWTYPPGAPEDECGYQCPNQPPWNCSNTGIQVLDNAVPQMTCNSTVSPPPGMGEMGGVSGGPHVALIIVNSTDYCDGTPNCTVDFEDELDPLCSDRYFCQAGRRMSIAQSELCDGTINCDDGSDESSCTDRFICDSLGGAKVSIQQNLVCDFIVNCDNGADEMNCTEDGRFYCESGIPLFVRRRQIFDGKSDCSDMSDECPSTANRGGDNMFSSRSQLISNPVLRGIVWLMGILAFCGNIIVIVVESKALYKASGTRMSAPTRTNHMLILNLAMADFIMGVYLIMLATSGAVFDGTFCAHELSWRAGHLCQTMGALVVISSETSVMTMVFLASFRLFAVFRPFQASSKPSRQTVIILIITAWSFSFFLAFLPFATSLQYLFADRAVIPDSLFFQNVIVKLDSAKNWAEALLTYEPELNGSSVALVYQIRNAVSWNELYSALSNISIANILDTNRFIGYYSVNSVCIPRLFASRDDRSWRFSISVTTFNFLAFIFVASAYFIIIIKASGRRLKSSNTVIHQRKKNKKAEAMQRKIYRLVATDFCCWVPISIMAFINFSGIELSGIAYVVSAIVLLPINSALNPILYSDVFDKLVSKIRLRKFNFSKNRKTTANSNSAHDSAQVPTTPSDTKL